MYLIAVYELINGSFNVDGDTSTCNNNLLAHGLSLTMQNIDNYIDNYIVNLIQ